MPSRRLSPLYVEPTMPRWWDRSVLVLTFAALALLGIDLGLEDPTSATGRLIGWIDLGLCAVFIVDFAWRFRRASHKRKFFRRNFWDLLGAIPLWGPLRTARAIRLVRLIRLTRIAALARRLARRYDLPIPGRQLTGLALVTAGIWLSTGVLFFLFEQGSNDGITGIEDALWWSMTTLSTVGYGDLYPKTTGGRVVAISTMILGVGVLGTLAAMLATALIDLRERGRRGARSYMLKDHVLVLGWNDKAVVAIDEFRRDPRHERTRIVIVADLEETPIDDEQVRFVRGSPSHSAALGRAAADRAAAAMIFARDPREPRSDHETAVVIHAVRRLGPKIRISAELVDPLNREVVEAAGADAVVDLNSFASALMTRSVQDEGVDDVIAELLTSGEGSEIYRITARAELVGKTWREYASAMLERGCMPIGIAQGKEIRLTPDLDYRVAKEDEIFVVSATPPD